MVLMNLFSGLQWRNRHRKTDLRTLGEGRKERVEMYGETNMEIYKTICKIDG